MYTLKSMVRRGTPLAAVVAIVAATVFPSAAVFADELNPLTERSLMLSSSAPGYVDTDGSGNSAGQLNAVGENYAPAGSGPNGKKTGETFSFKVSSNATIKAFDLQYCTSAAGNCQAPGNNTGDARDDLPSARETNAAAWPNNRSDLEILAGFAQATPGNDPGAGEFQVYVGGAASTQTWAFSTTNKEDSAHSGNLTGKNNYVTLTSATGDALEPGDQVRIVFVASETVYITNPGAGSFFVKMNTYNDDTTLDGTTKVDGGVTVANVMTDSIHITTKVLETMAFSVGTRNRDTVDVVAEDGPGSVHGTCDPIQNINGNRLNLGNPDAEYSLETGKAWDAYSYWRLSSNSSGGASVYYSGNTLANTVGDEIADMDTEAVSTPGTEQFGLGFVDAGLDTFDPAFSNGSTGLVETQPDRYKIPTSQPFVTLSTGQAGQPGFPAGQSASGAYDQATGTLYDDSGPTVQPGTAQFKFLKSSLTVPELIAQQNTDVISCATAKMRYVGNIAADTPAGVYTTKINYLAAPQY